MSDSLKRTSELSACIKELGSAQQGVQSSIRQLHEISSSNSKKLDTLTLAVCGNADLGIEGIAPAQKRMQGEHSALRLTVQGIEIDKKVLMKTAIIISALATFITSVVWNLGQMFMKLFR